MKQFQIFLILLFSVGIPLSSFGQFKEAYGLRRIETPQFHPVHSNADHIYVPMNFNNSQAQETLKGLDVDRIESISLVYTQYRLSDRFDQLDLNSRRTRELMKLAPGIKSNRSIRWYWVAQTGCTDPSSCKEYFHGFEIKLKAEEDILASRIESELLSYYSSIAMEKEASAEFLDSIVKLEGSTLIKTCDTIYEEKSVRRSRLGTISNVDKRSKRRFFRKLQKNGISELKDFSVIIDGRNRIVSIESSDEVDTDKLESLLRKNFRMRSSRFKNKRVHTRFDIHLSRGLWDWRYNDMLITAVPLNEDLVRIDSFETKSEVHEVVHCHYVDTSKSFGGFYADVSVIRKVFDRNADWTNCLVVTDVTGSMSPYLGQFLAWHQLNIKKRAKNRDFVFFNDGDNMSDALKLAGNVGGTYYVETNTYTALKEKLDEARNAGGGGDAPENNIEAVLFGLNKNPRVSSIVMVADNWATPRDLDLLGKVKKPIRLILCGTSGGFNVEYLNMIRKNGGSLHTIENDLMDLAKMSEGEFITIQGNEYVIRDGKFKRGDTTASPLTIN